MDKKIFNIWLESIEKEEASVYAKVLTTETNAKQRAMIIKEDGTFIGSIHNEAIDEQVVTLSKEILNEKNPSSFTKVFPLDDGTELQVFIDVYNHSRMLSYLELDMPRFRLWILFQKSVLKQFSSTNVQVIILKNVFQKQNGLLQEAMIMLKK